LLNKELISSSLPVLSLQDTLSKAQALMAQHKVLHLPVVAEDKYVGLVTEEELLPTTNGEALLETIAVHFSKIAVAANTHFLSAVQIANEYGLSVVPVIELINNESQWVGAIATSDLLRHLARMISTDQPGGIIVLETDRSNYSFSEISKLVETNDAHVHQLNTYYQHQEQVLVITLKINKLEVSDIVATFQRYDYNVKYYFGEEQYENELRSNYDHLMNYLKM
jgi:acetoin utilization protein AcuB